MFYMTQRIMDYRKIWHQDSLALDNLTPDNLVPGQFGTVLIKGQFCTRKSNPKIKCSLLLYVGPGAHLIFLADAVNIVRGEFFSCREILNVKNS